LSAYDDQLLDPVLIVDDSRISNAFLDNDDQVWAYEWELFKRATSFFASDDKIIL